VTWTLELAANAAASSWTDIGGIVERSSIRMGGQAANGAAGTGFGFNLDDDAASRTIPARRVVRLTIGSTVVGRGRVASKAVHRGTRFDGDARRFDVELGDANMHLQGIPIDGWKRPAETDVVRMQALAATYLAGSPRASTNLATTYLSTGDPVTLPAHRYDATNPLGVIDEITRATGKFAFITADDEIFYDAPTSTAYAASLSVTDVSPNMTSSFPPDPSDGSPGSQDGSEFLSGATGRYGSAGSVTDIRSSAETAHDYWREVINLEATASAGATRELTGIMDQRSQEEERFTFGIHLTEAQITLIKYGMTFSFRVADAAVTSARVVRASQITYEELGEGAWLLHVLAGFPEKLAPRLGRGKPNDAPFDGSQDQHYYFGTFTFASDDVGSARGVGYGSTVYSDANLDLVNFADGTIWTYAMGMIINEGSGGSNADYAPSIGVGTVNFGGHSIASWAHNLISGGSVPPFTIGISGSFTISIGAGGMAAVVAAVSAGDHVPKTTNVTFWVDPDGWVVPSPTRGQQVLNDVATSNADGTTTTYNTRGNDPFRAGTMHVKVNGVDWTKQITSYDASAGTVTLAYAPKIGSTVILEWVAA
jgi:hypothetical protein